ncbi:hypothetical protein AX774_g1366 [Zancudomyces culisetae]|uniref:Uncharacterized protein n=1 Tax=Zancudomyces culisetae TaxID=1213189 RepID=A0A1R1PVY8_ZANCU|nr:hypothetical protein AX774_g1366 [Zancudomyces culisetae]|eukprot:OMH85099.1 hypothetical protein AX774_g1366 [Zancudomyces culisetae]
MNKGSRNSDEKNRAKRRSTSSEGTGESRNSNKIILLQEEALDGNNGYLGYMTIPEQRYIHESGLQTTSSEQESREESSMSRSSMGEWENISSSELMSGTPEESRQRKRKEKWAEKEKTGNPRQPEDISNRMNLSFVNIYEKKHKKREDVGNLIAKGVPVQKGGFELGFGEEQPERELVQQRGVFESKTPIATKLTRGSFTDSKLNEKKYITPNYHYYYSDEDGDEFEYEDLRGYRADNNLDDKDIKTGQQKYLKQGRSKGGHRKPRRVEKGLQLRKSIEAELMPSGKQRVAGSLPKHSDGVVLDPPYNVSRMIVRASPFGKKKTSPRSHSEIYYVSTRKNLASERTILSDSVQYRRAGTPSDQSTSALRKVARASCRKIAGLNALENAKKEAEGVCIPQNTSEPTQQRSFSARNIGHVGSLGVSDFRGSQSMYENPSVYVESLAHVPSVPPKPSKYLDDRGRFVLIAELLLKDSFYADQLIQLCIFCSTESVLLF